MEESCADVPLVARSAGHTKVSIAYKHDVFELRATVTVAAYRPLKAILLPYLNLVFLCSEKILLGHFTRHSSEIIILLMDALIVEICTDTDIIYITFYLVNLR